MRTEGELPTHFPTLTGSIAASDWLTNVHMENGRNSSLATGRVQHSYTVSNIHMASVPIVLTADDVVNHAEQGRADFLRPDSSAETDEKHHN
jgi:hypothetical protein